MQRLLLLCLVTACAASSVHERPGPRGLRADQHLAIADRENERANELTHWPDPRAAGPGAETADRSVAGNWYGSWDTSAEHQRLALAHRSAAAQLEDDYARSCGDSPAEAASVSPLQRFGMGGSPIPGGTLVLLSTEAGPPDRLLAALRCHRAWMMLGRSDMDDCPLDLAGLQVNARGDEHGIELTLTVSDPRLVDELRRRTAHDLESGHAR